MKADDFRALALALPGAVESSHMNHPDFRVGGKVFASLGPEGDQAMVKLSPEQQTAWLAAHPAAFEAIPGAWGRQGCTRVLLARAKRAFVRQALTEAWRGRAPKKLLAELDEPGG
jgi:hypothetical protein